MKKIVYILALLLFLVTLHSCIESIPVPVVEVDEKLRFESDISTTKGFSAKITTSTGLDDIDAVVYPEDIYVQVSWGTEDDAFEMPYYESCSCYQNLSEKAYPGRTYKLIAEPTNNNDIFEDIRSNMRIPNSTSIDTLEGIRMTSTDGVTTVFSMLNLANHSNNYYHILPFRKETEIVIDGNDEEQEVYTGNIEYLELIRNENDNLYLEQLYHQVGFLADFKGESTSDNPLVFQLLSNDILDYKNEAFTKIFFEVRTLTESYYEYEKYLSRKLASHTNGEVTVPISYSNIINGLGYFGGYSVVQDSIDLQ